MQRLSYMNPFILTFQTSWYQLLDLFTQGGTDIWSGPWTYLCITYGVWPAYLEYPSQTGVYEGLDLFVC
jgi:hypothetical protein